MQTKLKIYAGHYVDRKNNVISDCDDDRKTGYTTHIENIEKYTNNNSIFKKILSLFLK